MTVKVNVKITPVCCHEDVEGNGGIAPHIINFDTKWRWMDSLKPQPLYLTETGFP
jgi:hypothetical protein